MARKMKKFSAGGAQGRYDRRMADIKKDFEKDSKGKSGRELEVLEAKRAQRTADAEDDRAKRMGLDRTATRAAEKLAESNLTKTRKYGAPQSVTKDTAGPTGKITDTLGALTAPKSGLATAPAKKSVQKPVQKPVDTPAKQDKPKDRYYVSPENRKAIDAAAKKEPISKFDRQAFSDLKTGKNSSGAANIGKRAPTAKTPTTTGGTTLRGRPMTGGLFRTSDEFRKSQEAKYGKAKGGAVKKKGTTMKYAKGGSTPANKKPTPKEPITGGANTVPLTPQRKEFLKELEKRNAKPGMAKGGKAATKFGKAMVKKSADTKGRAMVKKAGGGKCYASGGLVAGHKSADGIAVRGKTKTSMTKMKKGGSC